MNRILWIPWILVAYLSERKWVEKKKTRDLLVASENQWLKEVWWEYCFFSLLDLMKPNTILTVTLMKSPVSENLKIYSKWEACWAFCLQQLQGRKCFTRYWQIHKFFLFCQRKKGRIPLQLVFNVLCRKEATELKRLIEYYSEQNYEQLNRIELKCWNPPTPRGDTFSCLSLPEFSTKALLTSVKVTSAEACCSRTV